MKKIRIDGKTFFADDGEKLSDILIKAGKSTEHLCGGKGICRKCRVFVDGKETLSCQYRIHTDIEVTIPESTEILSVSGAEESGTSTGNTCLALDIGTTTLALAQISCDESRITKVITATNPQRAFGADIMTRIEHCMKNGCSEMTDVLIKKINNMIAQAGFSPAERLYVSGNTTMLHLFFGIDPSGMGTAPYTPVFLESKYEKSGRIKGVKEIISLPSVASFVGADIVAGLGFIGMTDNEKYNLLIDLGTNAEIILFSKEKIICTSAAAGPCFEGANISCGMSATSGAICSYSKGRIETIFSAPAKGICGTGLIDIIAELLSDGEIDKTGFMEKEEIELAENIFVNQSDIRQYQLAKSAVNSAISSLMKSCHIRYEDIDKVYISGGFSDKLNIRNAVNTGLIPKEFEKKCVAINNSSLLGCVKFALENNDLSVFIEKAEYIDLSADKYFADLFIENMMLNAD